MITITFWVIVEITMSIGADGAAVGAHVLPGHIFRSEQECRSSKEWTLNRVCTKASASVALQGIDPPALKEGGNFWINPVLQ